MVNKQKFKGRTLYRKTVTDNIIRVYNDTTFDFDTTWYAEANKLTEDLSRRFKLTKLQVAGIIASLSPLKSWNENKVIAESFCRNGRGKHTKAMINKARAIKQYNGSFEREFILTTLNGNKISNFFLNIAYPNEMKAVTIDRHAIAIGLGRNIIEGEQKMTTLQYNFFLSCYVDAGAKLNILPNQVQSITWEKWRALKAKKQNELTPF